MPLSEERKKEIMQKKNVVGVGDGVKVRQNQRTGQQCATVLVSKKKSEDELDETDLVPKRIDGEDTDVVEIGHLVAGTKASPHQVDLETQSLRTTRRYRPFPMGVSIGHHDITAGTAGFVAWKDVERSVGSHSFKYPEPVVVSNNHVLADENKADIGDTILQPGPHDGGKFTDEYRIGELGDYVALESENNIVDAAYCHLDGRIGNSFIPRLGVPTEKTEVYVGDKVEKYGRTTGYREGEVLVKNARVFVNYDMGTLEFENQIITTSMSSPGDSGSAGVKEGKLFGLLFAGSSAVTVFNHVDNVLEALDLRLEP